MLLDPDARQAVRCQACGRGMPGMEVRGPDVRGGGYLPKRKAQVGWDIAEGHRGVQGLRHCFMLYLSFRAQRLNNNNV